LTWLKIRNLSLFSGMVSKETQEYDIATVKLLLFSYNIYLFNVLFLSYKLSFVFVHENIQKRQSTVRRSDISLLFISYSLGLREKLFASLLAFIPNFSFFFFIFVEQLCGLMNTGGALTIGRSTQWTQVVFSFIIIWQCETTLFATQFESCRVLLDMRSSISTSAKRREIVRSFG